MRITRSRNPIIRFYTLGGEILFQVDQAKYLGVLISDELNWSPHVNGITAKANGTLGFLRRNLKVCPKQLKELSYMTLVRSKLEYCAAIWDPHYNKDITKLEQVQRRAARYVTNDYEQRSSVTSMLKELGWLNLAERRKHIRLALFYKIIHESIAVPHEDILIPADTRTRAANSHKFRTLPSKTDHYKYSFFPRTIPEWNHIPSSIADAPSLDSFKQGLLAAARPAANHALAASQELARSCI